jgi:DNA-binding winged helix-turn-helix (wHTH) protein/tetratricopeptide (TPR) repeat protein
MKIVNLFRFGEFEVDALARTVRRQAAVVLLNRRAFDVLLYFVHNPGRPISKAELLQSIWAGTAVDENSLAQSISVLRKALEGRPGEKSCVVTLPGRGYQFVAAVQEVSADEATQVAAAETGVGGSTEILFQERTIRTSVVTEEREAPLLPASPRRRPNWWFLGLASALALAGAALGWHLLWRHLRPLPPAVTVVLGDFENTSGEAGFDRVLNRALLMDLEQTPFLNLLPPAKVRETLAEMRRKRDEPLTPALAREVCQRNNGQAMLHATLAKLGASYLLMFDAEGCISGKTLASYKAQVASKEALLGALDAAASQVRRQLGESEASRERFQKPIAQATTSSLDALRAYSQGVDSFERGDFRTSVDLLKQAIALDPNFASAYRVLGASYFNRVDWNQAALYHKKAFDLRERTTERERLTIEVSYYSYGIADYEAAIETLNLFNRIYPKTRSSYANLCNLYTQLGEYSLAMEAGREALRIDPQSGLAAEALARACKRANAFAEAKKVAQAAIAAGKDRSGTHSVLFQIAYAEHDEARMKAESEWGYAHHDVGTLLDDLGCASATSGKLREATDEFSRARADALRNGDKEFADGVLLDLVEAQLALGETADAAASLRQVTGDGGDPDLLALLQAEAGDLAPAERWIATANTVRQRDTLHVYYGLPLLRARFALSAHKPAEAVQLLEAARPYQLGTFQVPSLRARAEAEAGQLEAAARDYRLILANQGVDPIAPLYPLAHLGLARVLAMQQKPDQARAEYAALFTAWKDADADLPLLVQARREAAVLAAKHP